MSSFNQALR
jgi:hypothetical protein